MTQINKHHTIDTTPFRVKIDEPGPSGDRLRKWNDLKLNIDRQKTIGDIEYDDSILVEYISKGSNEKVWAVCIQCGKGRWTRYRDYRHLCQSCSKYGENNPIFGMTGKNAPMFGKHHTEESRIKKSCTDQGITPEEFTGFLSDGMYGKYCSKFNESLKERIREKYGRKCLLCQLTEKENIKKYGSKLTVHHTDYNKSCGCDGNECRLVPLCVKCHGKTNGNRSRWEQLIMQKVLELFPDINFDSPQTSIADFYTTEKSTLPKRVRIPPRVHTTLFNY